jgi:hypothetical protein
MDSEQVKVSKRDKINDRGGAKRMDALFSLMEKQYPTFPRGREGLRVYPEFL